MTTTSKKPVKEREYEPGDKVTILSRDGSPTAIVAIKSVRKYKRRTKIVLMDGREFDQHGSPWVRGWSFFHDSIRRASQDDVASIKHQNLVNVAYRCAEMLTRDFLNKLSTNDLEALIQFCKKVEAVKPDDKS